MMSPKMFHILTPRSCKYVTLQGAIKIAKQLIFRRGKNPDLCRWVQCNHQGPEEGGTRKLTLLPYNAVSYILQMIHDVHY